MSATLDISLFDSATRVTLMAWRGAVSFGHGEHGAESATVQAPFDRYAAFSLLNRLSASLSLRVTGGGGRVWEGRVEDIAITDQGATVQALGRWRALRDVPYTAFWSTGTFEGFRQSTQDDNAAFRPERFFFEQAEGAYFIGPSQDNGTYAPGGGGANQAIGEITFETPSQSGRDMVAAQFRMQLVAAVNWRFQFAAANRDYTGATGVVTATHAGANLDIAYHLTFTGRARVRLAIFSAASQVFAANPGDYYIRISRLRLASSTAGRVNTTLTVARGAGVSQVATVGSTTGMYAGMELVINSGNATSEVVTVDAVLSSTTFSATFVNSYVIGNAVQGLRVTADEVVKDMRDATNTVNAGSLSASDALIQSPGLDIVEASYEDADMGEVAASLAALGDTSGSRYEVGVDGSVLYFRPVGAAAQAWYVDASSLEVQQTLDQLYNSVYARYQRADGFTLRTANQADATSISRYGLTRRRAVDADTTNATLAARVAQTSRDDTKDPVPRASLQFDRIYTSSGAQAPLWLVRNGDTITIRNLPPVAGAAVDLIRTFRVFDCEYDAAVDALSVTPETPLPLLEYLLARQTAFGDIAAGRLVR